MRPSQTQYMVGVGVGITVGLALPSLVCRLKRLVCEGSRPEPMSAPKAEEDSSTNEAVRNDLTPKSAVRIPKSALDSFLAALLVKAGASQQNADLVAKVLTYADARGIPSHGANRVDIYLIQLEVGAVDGKAMPEVQKESGCCAVIDGRNSLGAVTSELAMNTGISLAKRHGVGFVVCRHSNHYGAAGFWAQKALDAGMIGMSFTNTSPHAVPTGGKTRAIGTNPFCFFAPAHGDGGDSFQLDMATTVVPIGKVEVMDRLRKSVPSGWGVDRNGDNSTSAEEIFRYGGLYPLGGAEDTAGYKGYGLGMFVEIMCSVLSDAAVGPNVQPWAATRTDAVDYGHCFIVVDPHRFVPGFGERLRGYLETMRSLPGCVQVAGDPEKRFEADAAKNGILVHAPVAATLKSLAEQYGVDVPDPFVALDLSQSKKSLYQ